MTGDRRKHPRTPVAGFDGAGANGRRRVPRDPADAHFRRLGEPAAEDEPRSEAAPAADEPAPAGPRTPR